MKSFQRAGLGLLLLSLFSCGRGGGSSAAVSASNGEEFSGGATTVFDVSENAFGFPAPNSTDAHSSLFPVGNSFFKSNWVTAPSSTEGRDGLGPLFNAMSCSACHLKDGRGKPPAPGEAFEALLLRVSLPGQNPNGGPMSDPVYGDQIQHRSILGVAEEATTEVSYVEIPGQYADGTPYSLRKPTYTITSPQYGPLPADLMISPRIGNAVFGNGLLENIPESRILSLADENDANGDGISGRPNIVWNQKLQSLAVGRFGWKANQPTVEQQTAGAFLGDIGITSDLNPNENCSSAQGDCLAQPNGGTPEIDAETFNFVLVYMKTLAVPGRRKPNDAVVKQGKQLFAQANCSACHVPSHVTGTDPDFPELSEQTIFPYTDLLLHDMGPDLADSRPDFVATGSEWRTAPLWGLGLVEVVNNHTFFLHDGRARNIEEAILWHGGEAEASKQFFRSLSAENRQALIEFVKDL